MSLLVACSKITTKIALYAEFVKLEHSVFALPFALSAAILATSAWPNGSVLLWLLLAMVGGRAYGMGLNRLLDRHIDAKNPRTAVRSLPAGRLKLIEAWALTFVSLAVLIMATFQLPLICRQLLPIAIAVLTLYSYTKRFSWLCHWVLGLSLGCAAIGGWVAVSGQWSWIAVVWGACVMFWVAGFDLLYACQDADFDRHEHLHSVPARFGVSNAILASRFCHVITVVLMALFLSLYHSNVSLNAVSWGIVPLTAGLLIYEQSLVKADDLSRINEAFFLVNGFLSIAVFGILLAAKLIG